MSDDEKQNKSTGMHITSVNGQLVAMAVGRSGTNGLTTGALAGRNGLTANKVGKRTINAPTSSKKKAENIELAEIEAIKNQEKGVE